MRNAHAIVLPAAIVAILATLWLHALPLQTLSGLALSPVSADSTPAVTTNRFYSQAATLLLTNCTALAESGARADLSGLDIDVGIAVSLASTSTVWHAGAPIVATNGTWAASVSLPSVATIYWQLRLTDAATNRFHYPVQQIRARPNL
jgi:hypothetical protein